VSPAAYLFVVCFASKRDPAFVQVVHAQAGMSYSMSPAAHTHSDMTFGEKQVDRNVSHKHRKTHAGTRTLSQTLLLLLLLPLIPESSSSPANPDPPSCHSLPNVFSRSLFPLFSQILKYKMKKPIN
jgi:hypothetical protein